MGTSQYLSGVLVVATLFTIVQAATGPLSSTRTSLRTSPSTVSSHSVAAPTSTLLAVSTADTATAYVYIANVTENKNGYSSTTWRILDGGQESINSSSLCSKKISPKSLASLPWGIGDSIEGNLSFDSTLYNYRHCNFSGSGEGETPRLYCDEVHNWQCEAPGFGTIGCHMESKDSFLWVGWMRCAYHIDPQQSQKAASSGSLNAQNVLRNLISGKWLHNSTIAMNLLAYLLLIGLVVEM